MATENLQVSLGTDDGHEDNDTTVLLAADSINVGNAGTPLDAGLRWQSVNIPNAATITSAKLSLYMTIDNGTLSANIRGIDEDNTLTWASDNRPSQRTKTTSTITANEANWNNWSTGSWIDIDITSVIQEIVDRAGWAANNALAIVIENTGVATNRIIFRSYEYDVHALGAKLDIVYEAKMTKNTRSTMNVHPGVMFQTLTGGHGC